MIALTPHRPGGMELHVGTRPEPTHVAVFQWQRWRPNGGSIREVLGNRCIDPSNEAQVDALVELRDRLAVKLGRHVAYDVRPLAIHKERVTLSGLERMRRKMLRVERAYAEDLQAVHNGSSLFIQDELQRVHRNYERAVKLVEKNYGFALKDLQDEQLRKRAGELRGQGLLNEMEYNTR